MIYRSFRRAQARDLTRARGREFFAREPFTKPRRFAAGRSDFLWSAIFDKVGSSGVIKILNSMKYLSSLRQKNFDGEICLLRVDLNIKSNESLDSNPRVLGILPTIRFLIERKSKVIILSHRGRPTRVMRNEKLEMRKLTLRPFAKILSRLLKQPVKFISFEKGFKPADIHRSITMTRHSIFLLENLRFFPGEDENDKNFAKKLASLGTFYVNEAFAVSHRKNASMVAITKFLPSYAGLLLEKEIKNLSSAMKKPKHPFVIILGGAKISDKIGLIKNFLNKADYFLIGGGIANTFIAAQNLPIGESLYEKDLIPTAKKFLKSTRSTSSGLMLSKSEASKKIILPVDFMISNRKMLDIGPKTTENYGKIIKGAGTIVWNGPMGYIEDKKFRKGSDGILEAILKSKAFAVIGGGETTSILKAKSYKLKTNIFISTGGGAMLEYLAGKKLPGIEALK